MVLAYRALNAKLLKGGRAEAFGGVQAVEYMAQRIFVPGIDLRSRIKGQGGAVGAGRVIYFFRSAGETGSFLPQRSSPVGKL